MQLNKITELVNSALAGELLSYNELVPFLDKTVDDINTELNTKFPVFSELEQFSTEYTFIPDKYIRTVIIPGAAWYYYVMDEEGSNAALQYQTDYNRGMFFLIRDYLQQVPEEYQCDSTQGSLVFPFEEKTGTAGLWVEECGGID